MQIIKELKHKMFQEQRHRVIRC